MTWAQFWRGARIVWWIAFALIVAWGFHSLEDSARHSRHAEKVAQVANAGLVRAHNELCLSHKRLIKADADLAMTSLAPIAPPPNATKDQIAASSNATAIKAARLLAIQAEINAAGSCPHLK